MPTGEGLHLGVNAEELRDKAIKIWAQRNDESGLIFFCARVRIAAANGEVFSERRVARGELRAKGGIDFAQAIAAVQVGKGKAVG